MRCAIFSAISKLYVFLVTEESVQIFPCLFDLNVIFRAFIPSTIIYLAG